MRIARLDIDEGFLHGVSIEFAPGLNVLIGARGVGKTSVIEILRYVLGAPWFTADAQSRSLEQVKSVLGPGIARVTLTDGDEDLVITRSLRDEKARAVTNGPLVTVLAQNEIEAVGAQAAGRLGLVDRFRSNENANVLGQQLLAQLRSLGNECRELRTDLATLADRLEGFVAVDEALREALAEQQAALDGVASTEEEQLQLERLQQQSAVLAAQVQVLDVATEAIATASTRLATIAVSTELPSWPSAAGPEDMLKAARQLLVDAAAHIGAGLTALEKAVAEVSSAQKRVESSRSATDAEARVLRSRLDSLRDGLGLITKRVEELRDRFAQREALVQQLAETQARYEAAGARRRAAFSELEALRSTRYDSRSSIAEWLSRELAPAVKLTVTRGGARHNYAMAIADALKGSGLHYNRLAPQIAAEVSQLEFVECVERRDSERLAALTLIPEDRAQSVVSFLHEADLTSILVAPIDDAVDLWLLDGSTYKSATDLSIGQRCTAVLPVLLRSGSDVLIVDQPEDHLDNAFITGTLVSALRERPDDAQYVFASHNANVPVLGDADRIIYLESDGRRAFVRHQGGLDDRESVRAVTDVMEGGAAAFEQRAQFYAKHR